MTQFNLRQHYSGGERQGVYDLVQRRKTALPRTCYHLSLLAVEIIVPIRTPRR
jgi:hypothetical protein